MGGKEEIRGRWRLRLLDETENLRNLRKADATNEESHLGKMEAKRKKKGSLRALQRQGRLLLRVKIDERRKKERQLTANIMVLDRGGKKGEKRGEDWSRSGPEAQLFEKNMKET